MSKKICHHDQSKLGQILEQVEALSDVVDELRMELNYLKEISLNINHENVYSVKENNKIDYVRIPSVLRKIKAYFEDTGISTRIDETCELTKSSQILKKRNQKPIRFSTIYGSLKYFKNKIIKNVRNAQQTLQSPKSTKSKCVTSSKKQQEICLLRKKGEQFLKFSRRNEGINNYTDISEKLDNSINISSTSDNFAQADIYSQEDDEKSYNCNCLASQNVTNYNEQTSPLSTINDDRSVLYSDKLSKNYVRQTLKSKIKKYKKCSCGEQCLYALYKLPCNKYKYSIPEKEDDKISGLTLECQSFREKENFPSFINVDTVRNGGCFTDSSHVEIRMNESSTSLSVDLEVDIYNNYLKDVDELTKRRKARTYIVNKTSTRKGDLIKDFRAEIKPSFNIISPLRNLNEKKEKIGECGNNEESLVSKKMHIL